MKGINLDIKRGHIYMCDLGETIGSEQKGLRPVLVTKNQKGIDNGTMFTIIPITSKTNKGRNLPTHIAIGTECGLLRESELLLEQITSKDIKRFLFLNKNNGNMEVREVGKVSDEILQRVEKALLKDNGYIGLYFNETHAFHLLDLFCSVAKTQIPNLESIKNYFKTEFKEYCIAYNEDYKNVFKRYKSNQCNFAM